MSFLDIILRFKLLVVNKSSQTHILLSVLIFYFHYMIYFMSSKHRYRLLTFYHFVDIARPHDEVIQHSGFVQDI